MQQRLREERVVTLAALAEAEARKPQRRFWSYATLIVVLSVLVAVARFAANQITEASPTRRAEPVQQEPVEREKSEKFKEFERKIEEIRQKHKAREGAAGEAAPAKTGRSGDRPSKKE
jgi:hypothetical protein